MALVIEDGTIVAGANSFVTRAEVIAYAASRGVVIPDNATADVHAILAMDYLWTLCFRGDLVDPTQTTPYPRTPDYPDSIPQGIKNAQLQLSLDSANGIILVANANPASELKRSKIGPIEEEFFAAVSLTLTGTAPLTMANAWLAPFLCPDAGLLKTVRA